MWDRVESQESDGGGECRGFFLVERVGQHVDFFLPVGLQNVLVSLRQAHYGDGQGSVFLSL